MNILRCVRMYLLAALSVAAISIPVRAQTTPDSAAPEPQKIAAERDGRHDFDFLLGTWKVHLKRLQHPLTGSHTWLEFDGTDVQRQLWNGRANLDEFEAEGATGHVEGLTLRLYSPQSHQWSLYWASSQNGLLGQAMIGEFKNGRGEFFDQEPYQGRAIYVRYIWSDITANSCHFEQAFSDDGGKTWEANWIATFTREKR